MSGWAAKEELEFYDVSSVAWEPAGAPGLWQRVLAGDKTTGDHTRILRFDPGTVTSETIRHDFWEEVYVLEGSITDLRLNETFGAERWIERVRREARRDHVRLVRDQVALLEEAAEDDRGQVRHRDDEEDTQGEHGGHDPGPERLAQPVQPPGQEP